MAACPRAFGEAAAAAGVTREKRLSLSFLAAICDDPVLQSKLPQLLIGQTYLVFKQGEIDALIEQAPENIFLKSQIHSSWTNEPIMLEYLTLLHAICAEHCPD